MLIRNRVGSLPVAVQSALSCASLISEDVLLWLQEHCIFAFAEAAAERFRLAVLFLRLTKCEPGKAMRKTSPRQATLAMATTGLAGDLVDSNRVSHPMMH